MRIKINNAPKYIRRRVLAGFWGAVLIIQAFWIIPALYSALDVWLGV